MPNAEAYVLIGQPRVRVTVERDRADDAITVRFRCRPFGEATVRIFKLADGSVAHLSRGVLPGREARALCAWIERELAEDARRKAA